MTITANPGPSVWKKIEKSEHRMEYCSLNIDNGELTAGRSILLPSEIAWTDIVVCAKVIVVWGRKKATRQVSPIAYQAYSLIERVLNAF